MRPTYKVRLHDVLQCEITITVVDDVNSSRSSSTSNGYSHRADALTNVVAPAVTSNADRSLTARGEVTTTIDLSQSSYYLAYFAGFYLKLCWYHGVRWSWKLMEFIKTIFQAGKSWKITGYGNSLKMMVKLWKCCNCLHKLLTIM